ncbi:MAG: M55 family metallopeptidase [Bacillota bacterium]|nr:M55 family metallopeptidase [Bacillota bacterium]
MKVYISADLEGVAGVTHAEHTMRDGKEHERARLLMTEEVNAAIAGAIEAGATQIVVNDSHGSMRNIIPEKLHRDAYLISGTPKPLSMMEGIDDTFDAAMFVGYHAASGTQDAVLDHTYAGRVVSRVVMNGTELGETGINAAVAGYFGVPVAMVSGDTAVVQQARGLIPGVVTVAVKEAIGRYAARSLHPEKAQALIRDGAKKALAGLGSVACFEVHPPVCLELHVNNTGMADMAELIPGVERIGPRALKFAADDYITVFKAMRAAITLAGETLQ